MEKEITVSDPLYWGAIWDERFMSEAQKKKEGLKKYRFRKLNKAKKYHRYECKFWNNRLELMITDVMIFIDCYNIQENNINYSMKLDVATKFMYSEVKWFVETMKNIHNAIKNKKEVEIEKNEYEFVKTYVNGAVEFEKKEDDRVSNIVFWDTPDGGVIELSQGHKDFFRENVQIKLDKVEGDIYFPIVNRHLSIPIKLMEEILKDMEEIMWIKYK